MEMTEAGRISMRREGTAWVAYYAQLDTMDGALEIGRVSLALAERHPEIRKAFMDLALLAMDCAVKAVAGPETRVEWADPEPSPPHERMQ